MFRRRYFHRSGYKILLLQIPVLCAGICKWVCLHETKYLNGMDPVLPIEGQYRDFSVKRRPCKPMPLKILMIEINKTEPAAN